MKTYYKMKFFLLKAFYPNSESTENAEMDLLFHHSWLNQYIPYEQIRARTTDILIRLIKHLNVHKDRELAFKLHLLAKGYQTRDNDY
jgi:hypothetical protein